MHAWGSISLSACAAGPVTTHSDGISVAELGKLCMSVRGQDPVVEVVSSLSECAQHHDHLVVDEHFASSLVLQWSVAFTGPENMWLHTSPQPSFYRPLQLAPYQVLRVLTSIPKAQTSRPANVNFSPSRGPS